MAGNSRVKMAEWTMRSLHAAVPFCQKTHISQRISI